MSDKAKLLVVDNDPDMVEQLTRLLEAEGYQVIPAFGKDEAEELLLSVKPDLAVIDLMMEQMDSGFVLAHHLQEFYPQTPVILLTAVTAATGLSFGTQFSEARSWIDAGLVLDKPVRPEQLKAHVRRLLEQSGKRQAR